MLLKSYHNQPAIQPPNTTGYFDNTNAELFMFWNLPTMIQVLSHHLNCVIIWGIFPDSYYSLIAVAHMLTRSIWSFDCTQYLCTLFSLSLSVFFSVCFPIVAEYNARVECGLCQNTHKPHKLAHTKPYASKIECKFMIRLNLPYKFKWCEAIQCDSCQLQCIYCGCLVLSRLVLSCLVVSCRVLSWLQLLLPCCWRTLIRLCEHTLKFHRQCLSYHPPESDLHRPRTVNKQLIHNTFQMTWIHAHFNGTYFHYKTWLIRNSFKCIIIFRLKCGNWPFVSQVQFHFK